MLSGGLNVLDITGTCLSASGISDEQRTYGHTHRCDRYVGDDDRDQAVLEELSGLKQSQKMLNGYVKGIYAADRAIARSQKKKRPKRAS